MNPLCVHCGSGTAKHGMTENARRYKCKGCGKTFTVSFEHKPLRKTEPQRVDITHADIGDTLRNLRAAGGWTIRSLAARSGYSPSAVSTIEGSRGDNRRGGYWRTVCDLIDAMGYDVIIKRRDHA